MIGNSVIFVGVLLVTGIWWLVHSRAHYSGPKLAAIYANN
jgi:hypothetical protein